MTILHGRAARRNLTVSLAALIFATTLTIFMISRVRQVPDSTYSMEDATGINLNWVEFVIGE